MSLGRKMTLALAGMVMLVLLAAGVGLFGMQRLGAALDMVSGPAWGSADGSVETMVGVQEQLIGVRRALARNDAGAVTELRGVVDETQKAIRNAMADMDRSGLFSDRERAEMSGRQQRFDQARDHLMATYAPFQDAYTVATAEMHRLLRFMDRVEEVGDGQLDELETAPNRNISWNGGLGDRWDAADGSMEGRIALLEYLDRYQRMIAFRDEPAAMLAQMESWATVFEESFARLAALEVFDAPVPADSGETGTFAQAIKARLAAHKTNFATAVETFQAYRQAKLAYEAESESFLNYVRDVRVKGDEQMLAATAGLAGTKAALYTMIGIAMLLAMGTAAAISWWITRSVVRPVTGGTDAMTRMATGDLTGRLPVTSRDEIGLMAEQFNHFSDELGGVIHTVKERAAAIANATREVAAGNADLSSRTEQQAAALEETASSMEEMTANVRESAHNAATANQLARDARGRAESGGQVVSDAIAAMHEISAASAKIADIIGMVSEIAFQTNLLALNASVEAARAGEQGRGFAVVAVEVRNLAQRSATAASDIRVLIDDTVNKVNAGSKLVEACGDALHEIVTGISKVSDMVGEINAASQEQAHGIDQVNTAIMQMDTATQQNAALVEETTATSDMLATEAEQLAALMERFRLNAGPAGQQAPAPSAGGWCSKPVAEGRARPAPAAAGRQGDG